MPSYSGPAVDAQLLDVACLTLPICFRLNAVFRATPTPGMTFLPSSFAWRPPHRRCVLPPNEVVPHARQIFTRPPRICLRECSCKCGLGDIYRHFHPVFQQNVHAAEFGFFGHPNACGTRCLGQDLSAGDFLGHPLFSALRINWLIVSSTLLAPLNSDREEGFPINGR